MFDEDVSEGFVFLCALCMCFQGGWTALHRTCVWGHVEVVHALIAQYGAQVEAKNEVSADVMLL